MLIILIKKEYELVDSFFQFLYLLIMKNSSISSASEYRPKDFNEIIGQDAIVKTLSNAIDNQKIPQALLFCGPRGVGKTSCARILAKKINDLDENFEYNIFELDAASNNSVEDIRNITEQIRIPPQYGKFKVYIIDEVHMLSNAAFNAFLKLSAALLKSNFFSFKSPKLLWASEKLLFKLIASVKLISASFNFPKSLSDVPRLLYASE